MHPNGYNLQSGGRNFHFTEETKKILREKAKGRKPSEATKLKLKKTPEQREVLRLLATGRKHTPQAKRKISDWGKGRPKSEEHKTKIKEGQPEYTEERREATSKFNKETKSKKVSQFTKEGDFIKTFDSLTIASQETGTNISCISRCALGNPKNKTANGFVWKFAAT